MSASEILPMAARVCGARSQMDAASAAAWADTASNRLVAGSVVDIGLGSVLNSPSPVFQRSDVVDYGTELLQAHIGKPAGLQRHGADLGRLEGVLEVTQCP